MIKENVFLYTHVTMLYVKYVLYEKKQELQM